MPLTFDPKIFDDIERERAEWQGRLEKVFSNKPERLKRFSTVSDSEINPHLHP